VFEARRTAGEQDREIRASFLAGPVEAVGSKRPFDLVLCNMIWERMRPLAPGLRRLLVPAGRAVLSGLLQSQEEAVTAELRRVGLRVEARRALGEWLALVVARG
ncbi:MAG TPA: hypothetical protein ENK19_00850, partial [Acidobacteria bacterium]|nr:hypothetical protein [Acidobacteriota bacterium]